ncbi:nuclear transport factor 2 family protein [Flaviramulus sp. BrNp1-15]|uniref:DUF4440 domain-containing protein n=1 Tax=Flaviramulus sp. BrNp1-15 TaxID=2916754 RepID=UPI001EE995E2|nr:DUF4440 domain-containing protein [Flaviramulus sp. BrNp1-15]ULC59120.1 nuclear transport factor 2 family protein [Flaviramulus sp. BrNp1-15]
MKKLKFIVFSIFLVFGSFSTINAQVERNSELFKILKSKDSLLFKIGFNTCDISQFKNLMSEDFEFYHDKSGVLNSKEAFIKVMENGLCAKTNPYKARRELIAGSMKIYPLYNNNELYGAIQNGNHRFFESFEGNETAGNIAKFSHLWIIENKQWHVKRILSFDHQMP